MLDGGVVEASVAGDSEGDPDGEGESEGDGVAVPDAVIVADGSPAAADFVPDLVIAQVVTPAVTATARARPAASARAWGRGT